VPKTPQDAQSAAEEAWARGNLPHQLRPFILFRHSPFPILTTTGSSFVRSTIVDRWGFQEPHVQHHVNLVHDRRRDPVRVSAKLAFHVYGCIGERLSQHATSARHTALSGMRTPTVRRFGLTFLARRLLPEEMNVWGREVTFQKLEMRIVNSNIPAHLGKIEQINENSCALSSPRWCISCRAPLGSLRRRPCRRPCRSDTRKCRCRAEANARPFPGCAPADQRVNLIANHGLYRGKRFCQAIAVRPRTMPSSRHRRETCEFLFREYEFSRPARLQKRRAGFDDVRFGAEFPLELVRQTGGSRPVVSHAAVVMVNFIGFSPYIRTVYQLKPV